VKQRDSRAVVVGGGIIGGSVAYFLARDGWQVTLLERDQIGVGASGAAAGMLAPYAEAEESGTHLELARQSLRKFPSLVEDLRARSGIDPELQHSGTLRVAFDETARAELVRRREWMEGVGAAVEWLEGSELRRQEPAVSPSAVAALLSPEEGQVHSPRLTAAFIAAAQTLGAEVRAGLPVTGLRCSDGQVHGVQTPAGPVEGDVTVICGGAWTPQITTELGVELPVRPIRGQIVLLRPAAPLSRRIIWGPGVYLVPRADGSLVVGSTMEDVGFDCRPTAAGVARLLPAAMAVLPALAESTVVQAWAGLRPGSPDHQPLVGPLPGWRGVIVATGHHRNGILLSAITGELVAQLTREGKPPAALAPLLPGRFLAAGRS